MIKVHTFLNDGPQCLKIQCFSPAKSYQELMKIIFFDLKKNSKIKLRFVEIALVRVGQFTVKQSKIILVL